VGATGAVGQVFLDIVQQRKFPASQIRLCASARSVGKKVTVNGEQIAIEVATPKLFSEVDIVFIAAGSDISKAMAPIAVEKGAVVVDKSSAFRMDPNCALVVPEVNGDDLVGHKGITSVPNCSTTPLVMVLKPLNDRLKVRRVIADTYQSVSGTGVEAIDELRTQTAQIVKGEPVTKQVYPHQIAFNLFPHIETFKENGYTTEEIKMTMESRKILHLPNLAVSATCVRVPVMVSHSESVHIDFEGRITPDEVRKILSNAPGIKVVDDPSKGVYPTPLMAEGKDEVFVGRIREDASNPNGIAMWLVSDNLRKGAALNGIQIAEELLRRDLVGRKARV